MTPKQIGQEWFVFRRWEQLAGPFPSNAAAWRWIDRHEGQPISRSEKTAEWMFDKSAGGQGL
ncbi:hypothetical protein [Sinorhizobium fredii]|uniref:hypothetical protein n=1 Tax=Rhizobium fredii TaxID=380 RepID=UPI0004B0CD4B|nr:hypothetical protein [Sinorhizobium fredii]ASY69739.1 hypothetical protein SF83666_c23230 [Sinorhizobium fredii CCBAU 83666]